MNSKKKNNNLSDITVWIRASELFEEICALPELERERRLKQAAIEEPLVEKELRKLLPSLQEFDIFLEISPLAKQATLPLSSGEITGDFKIKRVLGKGGFATVYLAKQISLNRLVALKISGNTGQEARTMASLEQDHIVRVFSESVDLEKNQRLICMQYVPGITLQDLLNQINQRELETISGKTILEIIESQSTQEVLYDAKLVKDRASFARMDYVEAVLWIGARIAQALAFAHRERVLHLDVKPANILLSIFGKPFLTDFNVSKDARNQEAKGQYGGSDAYMSPEQEALFKSRNVEEAVKNLDARSDIYSLGIVLREMLEARGPMDSKSEILLSKATSRNPDDRFSSGEALSDALENLREKRTIANQMPKEDGIFYWGRKNPLLALTFFLVVPSLLGSLVDISYNYFQIVSQLTLKQQRAFELLNYIYKPLIYFTGVGYWVWNLNKIKKEWVLIEEGNSSPNNIRKMRRQVLRIPLLGVLITSFGWGVSAILYPLVIYSVAPISFSAFTQFLLSFVFSWFVCFSYSFIFHQYLILRVIYPELWAGREEIKKTAAKELHGVSESMRKIYLFSSLTPLFGAALILGLGTGSSSLAETNYLKIFIVLCMGVGIIGVNFVLNYSQKITKILYALTGESEGAERRK